MGVGRQIDPAFVITAIPIEVEPLPPIVIERPVFIPETSPLPIPPQGRSAVQASLREGIVQPQDFRNAAMIYDFDRDLVFEVFTQPLRVTNITLQPGEQVVDSPFISDSDRWMLGAGVSYYNGIPVQHIYVKPTAANLVGTLIINTDRRVYHLILRSFADIHMPIVKWRYHDRAMPQNFIARAPPGGTLPSTITGVQGDAGRYLVDPNFLSFNYRITWGIFRRPAWLPTLVYDDGRRTYIVFPQGVLMRELPAVFENRADIVNFRVNRNVMIIDKLVEQITIRLGNRVVTVEKMRGN